MQRRIIQKKQVALVVLCLLFLILATFLSEVPAVKAQGCTSGGDGGNMNGFAWSETIGWISLNSEDEGTCTSSTYGITIDEDGNLEGFAWSENVGWIQFGGLSGFPSGDGTVSSNAMMVGNAMHGWARVLSYGDSQAGGWDGWISLSGTGYGPTLSGGAFSGYAWGGDVIGWIDFNTDYDPPVTTDFSPCTPDPQLSCIDATHWDNACTPSIPENNACAAGLVCSEGASACVIPSNALGELNLRPSLVPTGNTTEISWDVQNTESCHVFGANGDEWWSGASSIETSSPITTTTLYTLECANLLGAATTTVDTAWAVVVPTWVER